MMPEAWAFQRGQARLKVPTWGNMAPDLACVAIFCTPIDCQSKDDEGVEKICVFNLVDRMFII